MRYSGERYTNRPLKLLSISDFSDIQQTMANRNLRGDKRLTAQMDAATLTLLDRLIGSWSGWAANRGYYLTELAPRIATTQRPSPAESHQPTAPA